MHDNPHWRTSSVRALGGYAVGLPALMLSTVATIAALPLLAMAATLRAVATRALPATDAAKVCGARCGCGAGAKRHRGGQRTTARGRTGSDRTGTEHQGVGGNT